jgi:probable addiction module antidote protein
MKLRNFDEFINEELQNSEFASTYLQESLEEGGIPLFLIALRQVIQAKKGLTKVLQQTDLDQDNIYKTVFEQENPPLLTIEKVLKSLGMKLTIIPDS